MLGLTKGNSKKRKKKKRNQQMLRSEDTILRQQGEYSYDSPPGNTIGDDTDDSSAVDLTRFDFSDTSSTSKRKRYDTQDVLFSFMTSYMDRMEEKSGTLMELQIESKKLELLKLQQTFPTNHEINGSSKDNIESNVRIEKLESTVNEMKKDVTEMTQNVTEMGSLLREILKEMRK